MSYYKEKKKANRQLKKILEERKKAKKTVLIASLVLKLTDTYEISDRAIFERIKLYEEEDPEMLIDEGIIKWR